MLHNWQQLDVSKIHALGVLSQPGSNFSIGQGTIVVFRHPHPRTQMDFIHGDRRMQGLPLRPGSHPVAIRPFIIKVPNYRGSSRRPLMKYPDWIGFISDMPVVLGDDAKFVQRALGNPGQKSFPNTRISPRAKLMCFPIPAIEVSNDGNFPRVWRPDSKASPGL